MIISDCVSILILTSEAISFNICHYFGKVFMYKTNNYSHCYVHFNTKPSICVQFTCYGEVNMGFYLIHQWCVSLNNNTSTWRVDGHKRSFTSIRHFGKYVQHFLPAHQLFKYLHYSSETQAALLHLLHKNYPYVCITYSIEIGVSVSLDLYTNTVKLSCSSQSESELYGGYS